MQMRSSPSSTWSTCLSTIEHIGLGRYGDPIDPWGDVKMARNLARLLRPGGTLLISFPCGPGCVVFNKHRIYTPFRREALFGDLRRMRRVSTGPGGRGHVARSATLSGGSARHRSRSSSSTNLDEGADDLNSLASRTFDRRHNAVSEPLHHGIFRVDGP